MTSIRFNFRATNNEAEYKALINGLEMTMAMGVRQVKVYFESQVVALQMSGEYEAKSERMITYQKIANDLIKRFEQVHVSQIPRKESTHADALTHLAISEGATDLSDITIIKLAAHQEAKL